MLKKKKIVLLFTLILSGVLAKAQVSYFGNEPLNKEKLNILKTTTTLFTLQYADYAELEKFNEAIKKTWTISPYKIIKPEELAGYDALPNYSFFYFDAFGDNTDSITNSNIVYALKLITPSKIPKQKEENVFGFVTLFADVYTNMMVKEQNKKNRPKKGSKTQLLNTLYNNSQFINWSPGFLAGYLKQINDGLLEQQNRELDYQFYNKVRLPALEKETLYVPEYVREIFSSQSVRSPKATPAVQEPYNYKLKFIPFKELDSLILAKDSNIKYLVYTQRSNDKIISVYDSRDDRIIYQKFSYQSPDFAMSDLIDIKNVIKSLK
ncbi:hypothetical protein [Pedobacter aquatilis]|uniref:hypothetical protein n=1 Tax=Pedobacter aquatilis TaxID=351343 RepID=UPI0029306DBC|nr:hypothetical protein [Pedobacter aquatilis]